MSGPSDVRERGTRPDIPQQYQRQIIRPVKEPAPYRQRNRKIKQGCYQQQILLPVSLHLALQALAYAEGRNLNDQIRHILGREVGYAFYQEGEANLGVGLAEPEG